MSDAAPVPQEWTRGPAHDPPAAGPWDLVLAQARRTPDAPAVVQGAALLTYRELTRAAAALADRLARHRVEPGDLVGICSGRGVHLPVAVLGVLAAGAAYVALDPAHPPARLAQIVEDAGTAVVVADDVGHVLAGTGPVLVPIGGGRPVADAVPVPGPAGPDDLAYVLFTSGSTGRPKGVAVAHRSVTAFVTAAAAHFGLGAGRRAGAFSALGFDVSVLDLLTPLTCGGVVALVPDEARADPVALQRFLAHHEVTWGFVPPALLPLLDPAGLPQLRDVVTAGEAPGPEQVARWSAPPRRRLHNWYGPTEATVCVVGGELTGEWSRPVPIGRPLAGCSAHVLDEQLRPCAVGEAGELYLGGPQVAVGYWRRPELTAQRFVPDPFSGVPGSRLFRTGDRVAWEPDGRIGFLGRLDRQVKVQGQRVEIGEIEVVLRGHPGVAHAVVDAVGGRLTAYLTPTDGPGPAELRAHCATLLPAYMIPGRVVRLDRIPLTVAGKTDLTALRRAADDSPGAATPPPVDGPVGAAVAAAWSAVLGIGGPDPAEGFFAAGGHSLDAMRLAAVLRRDLRREVSVQDVWAAPTLAALAERVAAAPARADPPGAGAVVDRRVSMTPAQRRMWFVERMTPGTPVHNIAFAERIRGRLDLDALRAALAAVLRRHDALRLRFPDAGGEPVAEVVARAEVRLRVVDLVGEEAVRAALDSEARIPFDLATGPLLRAAVLRLGPDEQVLALTVHHTVFDGWSQDVLYRDLARAYAAALAGHEPDLPPQPASFAGYAAALADRPAALQVAWWTAHLKGAPTVVDLPRDRPRPSVQSLRGARCTARIEGPTAAGVGVLARGLGTTTYAVLLAAFAQLVRRTTGATDMIVGAPVADRDEAAHADVVGLLLQILPIRLQVVDTDDFAAHVRRVGEELAAAMAHRDAPLERLVDALRVPRDLSRSPLVQVLVNSYNFTHARLELPGCAAEPVAAGVPGSPFDLTLYVIERDAAIVLEAVHDPALHDSERVEGYLAAYTRLVAELTAAPHRPVGEAAARPPGSALPAWSDPLPPMPSAPPLTALLTAAASRTPDVPAVESETGTLTYRELAAVRAGVVGALRAVAPGQVVGVLATRCARLPALLAGVLDAGARWAVLDATLPPQRLAAQARAAGAVAVLAEADTPVPAELAHLPVVRADGPAEATTAAGPGEYLVFTSGTTGEPQPVAVRTPALTGFLTWYCATFRIGPGDRVALLSGLGHDPALREMFAPLTTGARLLVPEHDRIRDPARLREWLRTRRVTVAHLSPQLARLLGAGAGGDPDPLPDLRLVALAGDQLTGADVVRLRSLAPAARLVNLYGTTETPQAHAWFEVTGPAAADAGAVPVGHPVPGSALLVLDAHGHPAAVGELGEVVIRSRRLAQGYLDPAATARRFGAAPGSGDPDDRTFHTGDLGRHRPDGAVVLAGRRDDQVQVRGFRVELGEVQAVLAAQAGVRAAAAVVAEADGERVIRAFVVPAQPDLRPAAVLDALRRLLPEYAVPADLTPVPAIPLTPNGKVDRVALLATAHRSPARASDEELRTPTERTVAGIWRSVLGRPRIGAAENFFDAGGHSLALVAVADRLATETGRRVPIVELFRHPTVRALAAHLDGGSGDPGTDHRTALDRAARRATARRERHHRRNTVRGSAAEPGGSQP